MATANSRSEHPTNAWNFTLVVGTFFPIESEPLPFTSEWCSLGVCPSVQLLLMSLWTHTEVMSLQQIPAVLPFGFLIASVTGFWFFFQFKNICDENNFIMRKPGEAPCPSQQICSMQYLNGKFLKSVLFGLRTFLHSLWNMKAPFLRHYPLPPQSHGIYIVCITQSTLLWVVL